MIATLGSMASDARSRAFLVVPLNEGRLRLAFGLASDFLLPLVLPPLPEVPLLTFPSRFLSGKYRIPLSARDES